MAVLVRLVFDSPLWILFIMLMILALLTVLALVMIWLLMRSVLAMWLNMVSVSTSLVSELFIVELRVNDIRGVNAQLMMRPLFYIGMFVRAPDVLALMAILTLPWLCRTAKTMGLLTFCCLMVDWMVVGAGAVILLIVIMTLFGRTRLIVGLASVMDRMSGIRCILTLVVCSVVVEVLDRDAVTSRVLCECALVAADFLGQTVLCGKILWLLV